jgi:hypothetical protein
VNGSLTSSARIRPGSSSSPGKITITGDYIETDRAVIPIDLAGTSTGIGFSQLFIGGTARIQGTLQIRRLDPFFPPLPGSYTFLQAGAVLGQFSTLDPDPSALGLRLSYTPAAVTLIAIEPPMSSTIGFENGKGNPNTLLLQWTEAAGPWTLQYALTLDPSGSPLWSDIPAQSYRTNGGTISYTESLEKAGQRFFRLHKP